jgi:hypothetical protein
MLCRLYSTLSTIDRQALIAVIYSTVIFIVQNSHVTAASGRLFVATVLETPVALVAHTISHHPSAGSRSLLAMVRGLKKGKTESYCGLAHRHGQSLRCAYCDMRHKSGRWWGREAMRCGRLSLAAYYWCISAHVRLWRFFTDKDSKQHKDNPHHPSWIRLWSSRNDQDKTGSLIRSAFYRPDIQAMKVFWVPSWTVP